MTSRSIKMHGQGTAAVNRDGYVTVREWRNWPEGERWELIEGRAFLMSPSPRLSHQRLIGKLITQLSRWFEGKRCEPFVSPVDVFLMDHEGGADDDVDTVVQPDLFIVCNPDKCHEDGIHGAPDWVLEILSPATSWRDQTEKRALYEKHGVREYWILNPETLDLAIHVRSQETGRFGTPEGANLSASREVILLPGLILKA